MPRKNQRDAAIVNALLMNKNLSNEWNVVPIHCLPQQEVVKVLQKSIGFLAFGHPEGFGLPLAEAAACGCALIGYSGLGGREIFQLGNQLGVSWEVDYGDWQGFLYGIEALHKKLLEEPDLLHSSLEALSKEIRIRYSPQGMIDSVSKCLSIWESQLQNNVLAN